LRAAPLLTGEFHPETKTHAAPCTLPYLYVLIHCIKYEVEKGVEYAVMNAAALLIFSHAGSLRNLPANLHRDEMKLIVSAGDCLIFNHSPATVEQILTEQDINPLEVIVSRNGKLIPEDTVVEADDEIRITRIAHGG
jgi:sulfur carrier protein